MITVLNKLWFTLANTLLPSGSKTPGLAESNPYCTCISANFLMYPETSLTLPVTILLDIGLLNTSTGFKRNLFK